MEELYNKHPFKVSKDREREGYWLGLGDFNAFLIDAQFMDYTQLSRLEFKLKLNSMHPEIAHQLNQMHETKTNLGYALLQARINELEGDKSFLLRKANK